ncbi:uncharacterized protein LOC136094554 [Hydra vulgaris]|uniref:uncharacterized protein LOC136094554 n=1 Tax=Hydra vulgaris TaxID=6087 RepID=UPI0032EA56F8
MRLEKRAKNIVIYGVAESDKVSLDGKIAENKAKVLQIFTEIGVQDIKSENVRRLRNKTDAERQQDFILRTEQNKLNNALKETDPIWHGIRGSQIQKFNKKPIEVRQKGPYDFTDMTDIKNVFKNAKEYVDQKGYKDLIIVGDFNFPGISWSNVSINSIKGSSVIEHVFYQITNDNYLYQHVNLPTFQTTNKCAVNILDLIFTTQSANITAIDNKFVLGNLSRGHLIMCFDFILKNKTMNVNTEGNKFLYRKGDYNSISAFLTSVDWLQCFHAKNVQEMYDDLIHYTEEASRRKLELMIVDKAKKSPKLLYRYMNSQQYVKDSIKALRQPNGEITQYLEKIADLMNINFQNNQYNIFNLSSEDIHYDDVLERLNNLDQNKANEVDKLHPSIYGKTVIAFALPLTIILMESIEKSQLPNQFNSANITALYKKVDKTDSGNYRPILLPCITFKILKGIIKRKLKKYLYENNIVANQQHGFVKNRSCTTHLLENLVYIKRNVDQGIPVDVVLLDFKKAFDSVPHQRLISKLKAYGVSGLALNWFRACLSNRRQRVVIGDYVSTWAEVHSGVTQGLLLGPLLFILYINDIPESLKNISKFYADDTKIMSSSSSDELHNKLQCDLNSAYAWTQNWLLSFNIEKCLVMHCGYKNKRYPIYINGCKLNTSDSEGDLRVT